MRNGEVIEILGGLRIEVLISSESSNSTCCVCVETTPPGAGPPPHKHLREEEVFIALEGLYEFYVDGAWIALEVGSPKLSPRGTYHAFRNAGNAPARMMVMTNGGGIDEYFKTISSLCMPQDFDRLKEISAHYGYIFLPESAV